MSSLEEIKAKIRAKISGGAAPCLEPEPAPKIEEQPEPRIIGTFRDEAPIYQDEPASDRTREAWLIKATSALRKHFHDEFGFIVPDFRVSVGFPQGKRGTSKLKGQTIPAHDTVDNMPQVFITPVASTAMQALTVLATEMLTVQSLKSASGLTAYALKVGMEPNIPNGPDPMPGAPFLPGKLVSVFALIDRTIGSYPHAAVKASSYKPRDSAMIKVYCAINGPDGYKARIAQIWLDKHGAPFCPCHTDKMQIEKEE